MYIYSIYVEDGMRKIIACGITEWRTFSMLHISRSFRQEYVMVIAHWNVSIDHRAKGREKSSIEFLLLRIEFHLFYDVYLGAWRRDVILYLLYIML